MSGIIHKAITAARSTVFTPIKGINYNPDSPIVDPFAPSGDGGGSAGGAIPAGRSATRISVGVAGLNYVVRCQGKIIVTSQSVDLSIVGTHFSSYLNVNLAGIYNLAYANCNGRLVMFAGGSMTDESGAIPFSVWQQYDGQTTEIQFTYLAIFDHALQTMNRGYRTWVTPLSPSGTTQSRRCPSPTGLTYAAIGIDTTTILDYIWCSLSTVNYYGNLSTYDLTTYAVEGVYQRATDSSDGTFLDMKPY